MGRLLGSAPGLVIDGHHDHEPVGGLQTLEMVPRAFGLGLHVGHSRRDNPSRCGSARPACQGSWRPLHLRSTPRLDHQAAGRHEAREVAVAKLRQQRPHVAIDRLTPQVVARTEVAAHPRGVDPWVHRRGILGQQAPLADARDTDRQRHLFRLVEPGALIDGREDLLHLVADHMPAHLERLPVDEFTMRLVGEPHVRMSGKGLRPV